MKFNRQQVYFTLFALVIFSSVVSGQNKTLEIDRLMQAMAQRELFNGTVLVEDDGQVIYRRSFGLADFDKKEALQIDSVFELASISKTFTATAVLILGERGQLKYDDQLVKYFPELPYQGVTIRHLLTHTSGLPGYFDFFRPESGWERTRTATNRDVIAAYAKHKPALVFEPGTRWEYSNGGYVLLASLIEKISGQSYPDFLRKNIFEPLGMKNTQVYNRLIKTAPIHYAKGYLQPSLSSDEHFLAENVDGTDFFAVTVNGVIGDSAVDSTVEDLYRWGNSFDTEKLLSKKTIEEAFTPVKISDGSLGKDYIGTPIESGYGFGWLIMKDENESRIVWHNGGTPGYVTHFQRNAARQQTIILLSNADCIFVPQMAITIQKILNNQPYQMPKIPVGRIIARTFREQGLEAAIKLYHELKQNRQDLYWFRRNQLNRLGYELLAQKKFSEAIAIFKLNVEEYPQEADPYDSLGEAYMKNGDKELAIKNYEKSLALDPKNQNAVEMLKKLKQP